MKVLELEHQELQQFTSLLLAGLVGLVVTLLFSPYSQFLANLPGAIQVSAVFRTSSLATGLLALTVIGGFFFGIWNQIVAQQARVRDQMRAFAGYLVSKRIVDTETKS